MFNFHSLRSIFTNLKTESIQRTETQEYKIITGSDGSLMPITMYNMLISHTKLLS